MFVFGFGFERQPCVRDKNLAVGRKLFLVAGATGRVAAGAAGPQLTLGKYLHSLSPLFTFPCARVFSCSLAVFQLPLGFLLLSLLRLLVNRVRNCAKPQEVTT